MAFNGQCSIVMGNLVGWEKMPEKQGQGPQELKGEERTQWKQEPLQERGKGTAEAPSVGRYRGGSGRLPPSTPLPSIVVRRHAHEQSCEKRRRPCRTLNLM